MEKLLEANKTFESEKDRELANAPKDIPGWGHDADTENDPTYPIKRRSIMKNIRNKQLLLRFFIPSKGRG
jgi:hypothetical protein